MAWTLSAELQAEILRLHDAGYSYRQIERKIRVARATVSKIVRRGRVIPPPEDRVPGQTRKVKGRCPSCHCYVLLPCLACSLSRRVIRDVNGLHDDLALKLDGDDLARYQKIRESHFGPKNVCNRTPPVL
jgi:hypothetical protein